MPVEQISRLQSAIADGTDVAIGSREAPGAERIGEPARRHLMGRVFNWLVRCVAVPGVTDSQCGFKAFRREIAHQLFQRQQLNGWAFDVEVLYIARRKGYSMQEVPITWRYDASSRVRPVRDTIAMLRELCIIRWNALCGLYD
jgi:dolichyl-phosphate beta-glucosyltransferase